MPKKSDEKPQELAPAPVQDQPVEVVPVEEPPAQEAPVEVIQDLAPAEAEMVPVLGSAAPSQDQEPPTVREPSSPPPPPVEEPPAQPTQPPHEPEPAQVVAPTDEQRLRILRAPTEALEKTMGLPIDPELKKLVAEELGRRAVPDVVEMLEITKGGVRYRDGFRSTVDKGTFCAVEEADRLLEDGLEFRTVKTVLVRDSTGRNVIQVV